MTNWQKLFHIKQNNGLNLSWPLLALFDPLFDLINSFPHFFALMEDEVVAKIIKPYDNKFETFTYGMANVVMFEVRYLKFDKEREQKSIQDAY